LDSPQCLAWDAFRSQLSGTYNEITVRGSLDTTGTTCSDAAVANDICNGLRTGVDASFSCAGRIWQVGVGCSTSSAQVIELSLDGSRCSCSTQVGDLRPCIGNSNWGGIGTTCDAPTQTLEVLCGPEIPRHETFLSPVVTNPAGNSGHVCDDYGTCEGSSCNVVGNPNAREHGICQALGYDHAAEVVWGGGDGESDNPMPHAGNWSCVDYVCSSGEYPIDSDNCSVGEMLNSITCWDND
jgi:hypothetical protein